MWKVIIKNLWNHRKENGWIFTELIIVSIILWVLLDITTIHLYNESMPLGYDNDQLCVVSLSSYESSDPHYRAEYDSIDSRKEHIDRIARKFKANKEVEGVTYQFTSWNYINSESNMTYSFESGNKAVDSLVEQVDVLRFHSGNNYFETYGMETVEGSPSPEELSKMDYAYNDIIITEDYARRFFGEGNHVGKKLFFVNSNNDTIWCPIKGVLKDVRHQRFRPSHSIVYRPQLQPNSGELADVTMVVRLSPSADVDKFVKKIETSNEIYSSGNYYLFDVKSYNSLIAICGNEYGVLNRVILALTIFFLLNVGLGIVGTFWLQTRNRTRDAGVMHSFGATRWNIRGMLLGEGFVLSTVAAMIGCLLYYQVALEVPFLSNEFAIRGGLGFNEFDCWFTRFGEHFAIISLLCYAVVVATVSFGIYLPARKISNVSPIDALRDE